MFIIYRTTDNVKEYLTIVSIERDFVSGDRWSKDKERAAKYTHLRDTTDVVNALSKRQRRGLNTSIQYGYGYEDTGEVSDVVHIPMCRRK